MYGTENLLLFFAASLAMWITPGSDTLYILTRTISQGRVAGVVSVLGIGTGIICHTALAAFGLSTILATSASAFMVVKVLGAAYLFYLGFKAIRQSASIDFYSKIDAEGSNWKIYREGVVTNVLNPKIAVFFMSFLPQFVSVDHAHSPIPFLALGLLFVIGGTTYCLALSLIAHSATRWIRSSPSITKNLNRFAGLVFIGLGVNLLRQARTQ